MQNLTSPLKSFRQDEDGVTSIEYALIAVLIAMVIILSVTSVGTTLRTIFTNVAAAFA
ncbi:Flp family type IVb pilin [Cupriavidus basilensis]